MKVLIVKVSALGDVVHALPVLAWIRSADPGVDIDWLVEESFAPLLEVHPLVRRVHRLGLKAWRRDGWRTAVEGVWSLGRTLRAEKYDLVLDLQGNCKSGFFTLLAGAPRRVGFARDGVREWPNLLTTNQRVPLAPSQHHVSERSLALAKAAFPFGSESPLSGPLTVDDSAAAAVQHRLEVLGLDRGKLVVLHYGTTWTTKLWPLTSWKELTAALCRKGLRPVLTWGNEAEREAAAALDAACDGRATIWPRGSLCELVALLARADLVVGADTGPVHIAAAVGTPTVSLYRVTDAQRNGPRGERHLLLQSPLPCSPCLRKICPRDRECGESITVNEVLGAVEDLLDRVAP
jgi:heptosyltransferase-1